MNATKSHQYRGYTILPTSYQSNIESGERWYVQTRHHTGMVYDEGCCDHYRTLAAAKEAIDLKIQANAAIAD